MKTLTIIVGLVLYVLFIALVYTVMYFAILFFMSKGERIVYHAKVRNMRRRMQKQLAPVYVRNMNDTYTKTA